MGLEDLPFFIVHLADDWTGNTLCNDRPFKATAPEGMRVVYRLCEDCRLKAINHKETT